ncbi:M56 family peptidase [Flavivirga spongiicola]|uniref:Peptidase M56 domain-containing protein n=1 Tax=Flavivirga spongiicola TaxID=421621 RepID=A0ABU7XN29_9FLAO|nr:M56 family peptidase [Flavivirga sp. MEBiC05379]MDO5981605.1 M56 family metallopeptidase [Flavivirga sp. MEBiC05379]
MEYLLKVSAVIAIFYLIYKVFLQRDTFFESNRGFLLLGLMTSFIVPFLVIPIYIEYTPTLTTNYSFGDTTVLENTEESFNIIDYLPFVYLAGVLFFSCRFIVQFVSLSTLIFKNKSEKQNGFTFIKISTNISPFSFFNWIVYNPTQFGKTELNQIITHEKVHVRQYHSIDILLTQLSCIVLWFNPFIWFYSKDVKQNLEFIADQKAQSKFSCKKSYQTTLLKTSLPPHQMALSNNFYNSLIKKRIIMLHKSKSKKINLIKYAFAIPLLAMFLISFNTEEIYVAKVSKNSDSNIVENQENKTSDGIKIIFNKDLSDKDLKKIERKLKKNDIKFIYTDLNRNNEGEITNISTKFEVEGGHCTYNAVNNPIKSFYFYKNKGQFGVSGVKKTTLNPNQPIIDTKRVLKKDIKPFSITITKDFADNDFKEVIKKGKEKGVTLKFSKIKRNPNNEIIAIHAEFKNDKGAGTISFNRGAPIKPFIYSQSNSSFGFTKPINSNTYVIDYGSNNKKKASSYSIEGDSIYILNDKTLSYTIKDSQTPKFYQGSKLTSTDSIHFNIKNNIAYTSGNVLLKSDSLQTSKWKTSIGYPSPNAIKYSNSLNIKNEEKPLFILDGNEMLESEILNLSPNKIESISVLKNDSAIALYGKKAKNGVVIISTKKSDQWKTKFIPGKPLITDSIYFNDAKSTKGNKKSSWKVSAERTNVAFVSKDTLFINDNPNLLEKTVKKFNEHPLFLLNGNEITKKEIDLIDPQEIHSVRVIKDKEQSIKKYGKKAKNGVVIIKLKNKSTKKPVVKLESSALYVINGKEVKKEDFEKLSHDKIESINVFKDEIALKKYGNKGKNGVVEITTKEE